VHGILHFLMVACAYYWVIARECACAAVATSRGFDSLPQASRCARGDRFGPGIDAGGASARSATKKTHIYCFNLTCSDCRYKLEYQSANMAHLQIVGWVFGM